MRPCARLISWVLKEVDPVGPTHAVRHTCSGKLGIVKILRYYRSDIVKKITPHPPLANGVMCLSTMVKSGTDHHSAEIIGHKEDDEIVFIVI